VAKLQGAHVTAIASGKHEALLRDLGADAFIAYTRTTPEDVIRDADLIVDAVGGAASGRFLRTIRRGGALYPIFPLGFTGADDAAALGITVSTTQVRSNGPQLAEIAKHLDAGTIRAVIDSTYPLSNAQAAHERAARGHIQGKLVLAVQ
ncbi:zinc-binding dehydrogenase, partial [Cupriavidus plantarum]